MSMNDAPKDGRQITAFVRNTNRKIRVRWNGWYWDEGNGERWDPSQLVGWEPVTGMYLAYAAGDHWHVGQLTGLKTPVFTEAQAKMVAHLLNFLDDTIAIDDFQQKLDHVRSTGEWPCC